VPTSPERTTHGLVKASRRVDAAVDAPLAVMRAAPRQNALDFTLIAVVLAFAVGLSMVVVSLEPLERATQVTPTSRHPRIAQVSAASRGSAWDMTFAQPLPRSAKWTGTPQTAINPLFPQNGVTLWDRIRVSSKRDHRAFLLGTTIQLHTPAIAATPGPRFAPPSYPRT
jgi:hypothetical protein